MMMIHWRLVTAIALSQLLQVIASRCPENKLRRCQARLSFMIIGLAARFGNCQSRLLTNPLIGTRLGVAVYPFVVRVHAGEVLTLHPPDGPLASFPGEQVLFCMLLPRRVWSSY